VIQMSLPERGGDRVEKIVLGICAMDKKTVRHVLRIFLRAQPILRCVVLSVVAEQQADEGDHEPHRKDEHFPGEGARAPAVAHRCHSAPKMNDSAAHACISIQYIRNSFN
jgi:hypothetical protein